MAGSSLRSIEALRGPSTTELVFDQLYRRIVELDLPPGARLSEQDVSRAMGVSRQPVRDAFYRLSQIGLVQIQPQRATTVTLVSEEAVLQARFVRTALETETIRGAARRMDAEIMTALEANLAAQERAVADDDRIGFHALDDGFHQIIAAASGHAFAWALIRENKAHMDRVRWLSLATGAGIAHCDHLRIFAALADRDAERAAAEMRSHLGRILDTIAQIRKENPGMLVEQRA
ncbi:GntR family transcriptional regulator [Amaricoccus sp.]|uniref:GntR family transcriptional regulator n=1 Tax=Amaricoccus sp. TaxID=1872485 RepID=UPI001B4142F2|nr:GntR family transcriptional regulator [Amaricoccus sp.]MBP7000515.1 GntR family transcriptional regulator [Amaricoccus sp.]